MLRSILIGLDGSAYSRVAVELGIRWARRFDSLLVGLGVLDEPTIRKPEPTPIGGGSFKRERDEALLAAARGRVDELLMQFVERCSRAGVRCETLEDVGAPAEQIVEQSKLYDLVMLGQQTNFHFETQDWRDETLWQVLRQSSRPVVSVPKQLSEKTRVMVAYNGSPEADRALTAFESLGLARDGEIHIVSIDADAAAAQRRAEQAAAFLELHDLSAVRHEIQPQMSLSANIVDQVHELEAGLLVMGACGHSRWREVVIGSTTSAVVDASPAPVFLCH